MGRWRGGKGTGDRRSPAMRGAGRRSCVARCRAPAAPDGTRCRGTRTAPSSRVRDRSRDPRSAVGDTGPRRPPRPTPARCRCWPPRPLRPAGRDRPPPGRTGRAFDCARRSRSRRTDGARGGCNGRRRTALRHAAGRARRARRSGTCRRGAAVRSGPGAHDRPRRSTSRAPPNRQPAPRPVGRQARPAPSAPAAGPRPGSCVSRRLAWDRLRRAARPGEPPSRRRAGGAARVGRRGRDGPPASP